MKSHLFLCLNSFWKDGRSSGPMEVGDEKQSSSGRFKQLAHEWLPGYIQETFFFFKFRLLTALLDHAGLGMRWACMNQSWLV